MIIKLTEGQYNWFANAKDILDEDVFINNISRSRNKNTASLTYAKGSSGRNRGNKVSSDMLKTGFMDEGGGSNTYEVPLKGGFISYNITDIKGTEVMHYFKRYFEKDKKETTIKINDEDYQLELEKNEFEDFLKTFLDKVNAVVEYRTNEFKQENKDVIFEKVCIYPVPSSCDFNDEMAKRIVNNNHTICGLPVTVINRDLLKKNTKQLAMDVDFINKNQDYYNSRQLKYGDNEGTHLQAVENALNKLSKYEDIEAVIAQTNEIVEKLISKYYKINQLIKRNLDYTKELDGLATLFMDYQRSVRSIREASEWFDVIAQKTHQQALDKIAKVLKYSKGPSVEKRTGAIFDMLKQAGYIKGVYRDDIHSVCRWQPITFKMKYLGNDVRLALQNYFLPNKDEDLVKQEVEKTVGGVVVVFDDNVAGGATLSDICLRLKNMGMNYIIPITFGKMRTSYNIGPNIRINAPIGGFNY